MADLAGGLIPEAATASTPAADRRGTASEVITSPSLTYTSIQDRRNPAYSGSFANTIPVTWYKLRVRDSGLGPPAVYTIWTSIDPASTPPGTPVGSWVDRVILNVWTV